MSLYSVSCILLNALWNFKLCFDLLAQVTAALAETACHVTSKSYTQTCHPLNDDVMSTDILLMILKSVDDQIASSLGSGTIFEMNHNTIYFTSTVTDIHGDRSAHVTLQVDVSKYAHVNVSMTVTKACSTEIPTSRGKYLRIYSLN